MSFDHDGKFLDAWYLIKQKYMYPHFMDLKWRTCTPICADTTTVISGVARRRKVGGGKLFFPKNEKQKKKKKKKRSQRR